MVVGESPLRIYRWFKNDVEDMKSGCTVADVNRLTKAIEEAKELGNLSQEQYNSLISEIKTKMG